METSHSTVTQLSEDLMIEILVRLPVKSVLRFKSVCKTWNHLLKTPSFISMHHKCNSVSQLLMCSSHEKGEEIYINNHVFSFHFNHRSAISPNIRILASPLHNVQLAAGSCNGIVCYHDNISVFLCNPATREFKQLSPPSWNHKTEEWSHLVGLALGYDSTDIYDFKVLCLYGKYDPEPTHESFKAEIFTLSSNTWKPLHWGLDHDVIYIHFDGLFFANSFHFIVARYGLPSKAIACCDNHTERFRTMDLPSTEEGDGESLMVFKEFLSAVLFPVRNLKDEEECMEIWIMKDFGVVESWTKLYSIIRSPWGFGNPLCFSPDMDAILLGVGLKEIVSYHLNTHSFELIEIHGYDYRSDLLVYQETLVSIM